MNLFARLKPGETWYRKDAVSTGYQIVGEVARGFDGWVWSVQQRGTVMIGTGDHARTRLGALWAMSLRFGQMLTQARDRAAARP